MDHRFFESYCVNRDTAADICGVPATTLKTWLDRNALFPERARGSGHHWKFACGSLMTIRAVWELTRAGMSVQEACKAMDDYRPLGAFLSNRDDDDRRLFMTRTETDRWCKGDWGTITITINTRKVFAVVAKGLMQVIRNDPAISAAEYSEIVAEANADLANVGLEALPE